MSPGDLANEIRVRLLDPVDLRDLLIGELSNEVCDIGYCPLILLAISPGLFLEERDNRADRGVFQEDPDPVAFHVKGERPCPAGLGLDPVTGTLAVLHEDTGAVRSCPEAKVAVFFKIPFRHASSDQA